MDKYLKMFKPAMTKWLLDHYPPEEAKKRWKKTVYLDEKWIREEGDLGGKKNPMANNMLEAYAFFAFYEAVDHSFTAEDLNALIDAAMGKSIRMLSHCIELNPAFCDSDDAKYGNLHKNLKWARTGTIGKGASCCDFRIIDISRCPDYKD